jgi:hypothetical protein
MECLQRKKIVLCLNAHQLIAGVWLGTKYHSSQVYNHGQDGQAAFSIFLAENTDASFSLIVDVAEEDYQLQQLPHTSGRAKAALITRKLDQFCRGLTYKAASDYGRLQNQARSDCYLFSVIRHDKSVQVWVALLQAADVKLAGIYMLPMLSEYVLRQHLQAIENVLLCERLTSGLRQTFFANGRLQMSRLLPDIPQNPKLAFQEAEIEKTRLYLVNQRLIAAEAQLHVSPSGKLEQKLVPNLHAHCIIDWFSMSEKTALAGGDAP